MRPLHPCPICGHETAEACREAARAVPERARAFCPHCRDLCRYALETGPRPEPVGDRVTSPPPARKGAGPWR